MGQQPVPDLPPTTDHQPVGVGHVHAPDPTSAPNPTHAQRFDALYTTNVDTLFRFIVSRVGQREEAEDLTSQVFIKALRGADWSRDDITLRHWLFQVAQTVIIDHWRAAGRLPTISLDALLLDGWSGPAEMAPDAPSDAHDAITHEQAMQILHQLPEMQREVLRCRFLLRFSIKETAQHLGITEANAKVIQYRALKRAAELRGILTIREGASADGR